jgi:hypothetical protein
LVAIEIMPPQLTEEQRQAIHDAHDAEPVVVIDPTNQTPYVLLRADLYDRYRALFEETFDVREAYQAIDELAAKEGWNDPSMDAYDALDPRRP